MKNIIFVLAFATLMSGNVLVGCKPSTKEQLESREKVHDARDDVQAAKEDLKVAKKQATAEEWQAFKNKTDSIITENEIRIAVLESKMKKTGKSIDAKFQKNIDDLIQKNKELRVKTQTYKNDANADWQSFKREFNHDMDEMGRALKDLTVDNKK